MSTNHSSERDPNGKPSNSVETEVKVLVESLAILEVRLKGLGATLAAERVFERNVRYDDDARSLSEVGQVLRLRTDTRARLTFKAPMGKAENGITSRAELEVTVDDFDTMDAILQRLGYRPLWVYEKYRTTYHWHGCEIVLDEMPYGLFVEIEGEISAIESVLAALGLEAAPRLPASYSVLFLKLKQLLNLPFDDLTFANFEGIAVPADAFTLLRDSLE
jgi:adenylate cyclase class 2